MNKLSRASIPVEVPRPCPFVGCRYHLYLDVEPDGALRLNFPDVEPDELRWSCALDLADEVAAAPSELAKRVNLSREQFRKWWHATLRKHAEGWGVETGDRAPMLSAGDGVGDEQPEMGEVGDIEWG